MWVHGQTNERMDVHVHALVAHAKAGAAKTVNVTY